MLHCLSMGLESATWKLFNLKLNGKDLRIIQNLIYAGNNLLIAETIDLQNILDGVNNASDISGFRD